MKKTSTLHITKRDGRKVNLDSSKITQAMVKAFLATNELGEAPKVEAEAKRLTPIALQIFAKTINGQPATVETMQDVVEQVLMAAGYYQTAKAYILYRAGKQEERQAKSVIGVEDDLGLTVNQLKVMERRYMRHDEDGKVIETPRQLFERVAKAVAVNEKDEGKWYQEFLHILTSFEFVPAGCYLRGAGTNRQMLANCFVLPIEDSMAGIFDAVKWMALIHQKGGGSGFNFSKLRPKGDYVVSSGGYSSGPISFMKVFDAATRQVMQGGFRRGANMGILNVDHPDILDFITCKTEEHEINNFNISVGASDEFMEAVDKDTDFQLKNPRTGEVIQTVSAKTLFEQMITLAWRTGDPGMIYLDAINRHNPVLDTLGPMDATNPCGEQMLHPFDVCNLGSINLAKFAKKNPEPRTWNLEKKSQGSKFQVLSSISKLIDWKKLEEIVRVAVRFLDNGVDVSTYPIPQIKAMAQANRRIGLGIMGWADLLYQLHVPYNSELGFALAEKIMHFIYTASHRESETLAQEKGTFKNWNGSTYEKQGIQQRNIALTTIAPTGTISMVADCSSGIEPIFALSYVKNVVDDHGLTYVNSYFEQAMEEGIRDPVERQRLMDEVARSGSCQPVDGIPESIKQIFVTAHDLTWEQHVRMQAAFQKWTDNAVSKTINFPHDASIEAVGQAYLLAWKLGCKGITIYRDGSKGVQILSTRNQEPSAKKKGTKELVIQSKIKMKSLKERVRENLEPRTLNIREKKVKDSLSSKFQVPDSDVCPECGGKVQNTEGCMTCLECGYSKCSL